MLTIKELLDYVLEGLARNELDLGGFVKVQQGENKLPLEGMRSSDLNELILNTKGKMKDD